VVSWPSTLREIGFGTAVRPPRGRNSATALNLGEDRSREPAEEAAGQAHVVA
jgi:hypothetical protein